MAGESVEHKCFTEPTVGDVKIVCDARRPPCCKAGFHNFIVSRWLNSGLQQAATGFTCQLCLMQVEGRNDLGKLQGAIDARHLSEDEEALRATASSKKNKGTSREGQNPEG